MNIFSETVDEGEINDYIDILPENRNVNEHDITDAKKNQNLMTMLKLGIISWYFLLEFHFNFMHIIFIQIGFIQLKAYSYGKSQNKNSDLHAIIDDLQKKNDELNMHNEKLKLQVNQVNKTKEELQKENGELNMHNEKLKLQVNQTHKKSKDENINYSIEIFNK